MRSLALSETSLFDIVIPHYGTGGLTALCLRCLESIRTYSERYRLIFVDNASPEFETIREELERHPHLLIRSTENLGFVRATNLGLLASRAPYVVLMNNDTEAVSNWLPKLAAALCGSVGLAGPRTTTTESWQGRWTGRTGVTTLSERAMLAFFCVMIRRDVIEKVGLLDEGFGIGFGDDDYYCHLAQKAGFRLALVQDLVIPHHHRSTFRTLYSEETIRGMQRRALDLFYRKSGRPRPR